MTFPVLNKAKHSAFAACGQGKASMVQVSDAGSLYQLPDKRHGLYVFYVCISYIHIIQASMELNNRVFGWLSR